MLYINSKVLYKMWDEIREGNYLSCFIKYLSYFIWDELKRVYDYFVLFGIFDFLIKVEYVILFKGIGILFGWEVFVDFKWSGFFGGEIVVLRIFFFEI